MTEGMIYRKVYVRMYSDDKFMELSRPSPCGQSLWTYLFTGPHTDIIPGLFTAGEAALAEALEWPLKGFRQAFTELASRGMVRADWKSRVVWIPNCIWYNRPDNPNQIIGWRRCWDMIPKCELKDQCRIELLTFFETLGGTFAATFYQTTSKRLPKPFAKPFAKPLLKPANSKQEQEPESAVSDQQGDASASQSHRAARRFEPPTFDEVTDYCRERDNKVDPQAFIDHYVSNGWMVGRTSMKDWRAAVRTWERSNFNLRGGAAKPGLFDGLAAAAAESQEDGSYHEEQGER